MRRPWAWWLAVQVVGLLVLWALVRDPRIPLGVRGEWVWPRLDAAGPNPQDLAWALLALGAFAAFAAAGMRALGRRAGIWRESAWVAALALAAVAFQYAAIGGAPEGVGEEKVALVLGHAGSSGYYHVAAREVRDPWAFWKAYPEWIRRQDALHIGTHPPGLILLNAALLDLFRGHPSWARSVVEWAPPRVTWGFRERAAKERELPLADRAALEVIAGATLLACSLTVVPLYALTRSELPATGAWAAAALWPAGTSALMFQPTSDALWPLLAATALALAARGTFPSTAAAGAVLALGMGFTLAFLPVGMAVALVELVGTPGSNRRRLGRVVATGAGFLLPTLLGSWASGANPFVYWTSNLVNHARFYVTYPRSYVPWIIANVADLVVGMGLPAAVWAVVGFAGRRVPRGAWASLAVLVLLEFSGRNLGEVARLWLPMMPPLYAAAGAGLIRAGGGPGVLAATVGLMGAQVLALQAMVQVAYVTGA